MAEIFQPTIVVRLDRNDSYNLLFSHSFKWHLYKWVTWKKPPLRRNMTSCGIVISSFKVEEADFNDVKVKDLCAICFGGLKVKDEKHCKQL